MRVQVRRQVEKVWRVLKFRVEYAIMMPADVVGDMAVQDVGEYQRRGTIA
jgi:hypothetical protein